MSLSVICSLIYGENDLYPLIVSAVIIIVLGVLLVVPTRIRAGQTTIKDAILIASLGWIVTSAVSGLPFIIQGSIPSFSDAFFEMMSGYTTTGASILTNIEAIPHGLLFWRSETDLLGGMGFLTLVVLMMPHGMEGLRVYRAESSPGQGYTGEKIKARNKDAMVWLWGIYLGLNVLETVLLGMGGMPVYDSLCHSFATISTSGFSPKNLNIGHYDNAYFDWVISLFMFLGGMSFILFYRLIRSDWREIYINTEFRWYVGFTLVFCGLTSLILWQKGTYSNMTQAARFGVFQVTSLLTTTGFTTADYGVWPQGAQMFLYAVCFIGACAGSTSSGIKVIHFAVIWKYLYNFIRRAFARPRAVYTIQVNRQPVDRSIIDLSVCYFVVNIFIVLAGGCFMAVTDHLDFSSAMSSIIATLMNIGPGFGAVGPTENYAFISDAGKWFLSYCMLIGRLDMFSALVIFFPAFWCK